MTSTQLPRRAVVGGLLAGVGALGLQASGKIEAASGPTRSGAARRAVDPRSISWVPAPSGLLALTFDDGPDPATTPAILDILERRGVQATFFVIGSQAAAHPDLVRRMFAEGHALANHTYDHAPLEQLDAAGVREQLERGRAAIEALWAGERFARPPRGYTSPLVARVAHELGEREVFWTACLENRPERDDLARGSALAVELDPGEVVLLHDGGHVRGRWAQSYDRTPTVRALDAVLRGIEERGLTPVTLPQLVASRA